MTHEHDELVARVLEKLASGRDLSEEELEHLKALDASIDRSSEPAAPPADGNGADLPAMAAAAVKSERWPVYRGAVLVSAAVLVNALLVAWWVLVSFYVGHFTRHATRTEALGAQLPVWAFLTVLLALGAGAVMGRVFGRGRSSRRAGLLTFAVAGAVVAAAYAAARTAIPIDTGLYAAALAVLICASVVAGSVIGREALPFKRLKTGRELSGVFAGIAQELGWNVWWLRAAFIVFAVSFKLPAVLIYLLLDASMQVHPDDRANMWRFRMARWMRLRRA